MSLIIAFDLSLNSSGICILSLDKDSPIHYENVTSGVSGLERLHYNYNRYINLLKTYRDIQYIAYEAQTSQMRYAGSSGSILSLAENIGVWKLAVYNNLPYLSTSPVILGVPAQDIKKFATGNGKATKEEMIDAVNKIHLRSMRKEIPEHAINDCSDAYHLARMVKSMISKDVDYSKYIVSDYSVQSISGELELLEQK